MHILVTGATGFLGEPLVRRLLADGAQVRVLARAPERAQAVCALGAEVAVGEVTDAAAVDRALAGVSVVYHLAGKLFMPGVPVHEYERTHVEGTRVLVRGCQQRTQRTQVTRFIHCGTTGVLGTTGAHPADENAPYAPTNAYERTKLDAELLVRDAIQRGFPAVVVRPGLVYGPGDLHLLGFFRSIQRGLFRPIGRQPVWLHPIYIDDMTEALVVSATHPRAVGECFHIAGREPTTLAHLAATIADALEVAPPRGWIPLPVARLIATAGDLLPGTLKQMAPLTRSRLDFLTHSRAYDVSKAREVLGFTSLTDLPEGIGRAVAWYRQEGYLAPRRNAQMAEGAANGATARMLTGHEAGGAGHTQRRPA